MNQEEQKYLELMRDIIANGKFSNDRTGDGCYSQFGRQLRFSLADNVVPMITTKKLFYRGAIEELLFFIRGETNTKLLEEKGVNIWKGNTSREFLDSRGLKHYPEGEMGPMYGYVWRNWQGIDQLNNALDLIKNNPASRRIMVTAYDPALSSKSVLDPCHMFFMLNVEDGKLSLLWFQRSVDEFLGFPINLLSYAILTKLLAKAVKLEPGEVIFSGGNCHVYKHHVPAVTEQVKREPYPFPKLYIDKEISSIEDMCNLKFEDFRIENYQYHPQIKARMSI